MAMPAHTEATPYGVYRVSYGEEITIFGLLLQLIYYELTMAFWAPTDATGAYCLHYRVLRDKLD